MLTLFVVPTVYTIFDDLARWLRRDRRDLAPPVMVEPTVEAIAREPVSEGDAPAEPIPAPDQPTL